MQAVEKEKLRSPESFGEGQRGTNWQRECFFGKSLAEYNVDRPIRLSRNFS